MRVEGEDFNIAYTLDVCILSDQMSHIRFASLLGRIFSIQSTAQSNVEYSTSKARPIECRIFKIRPAQDVVWDF